MLITIGAYIKGLIEIQDHIVKVLALFLKT